MGDACWSPDPWQEPVDIAHPSRPRRRQSSVGTNYIVAQPRRPPPATSLHPQHDTQTQPFALKPSPPHHPPPLLRIPGSFLGHRPPHGDDGLTWNVKRQNNAWPPQAHAYVSLHPAHYPPSTPPASGGPQHPSAQSVVRSSSPTTSESSDMYYNDDAFPTSPGSATSATPPPTPRPTRDPSPASVVELAMEDFPPLAAPTAAAPTAHNKSGKKENGKKHAIQQVVGEDDPPPRRQHRPHHGRIARAPYTGPPLQASAPRTNAVGGTVSDMGQLPFLTPAGSISPTSAPNRNPASAAQAVTASSTNLPATTTATPPTPSAAIAASPTTVPGSAAHATTPTLEVLAQYTAAAAAAPAAAVVPNMPPAPAAAVQRIANNAATAPAGTAWRTQDGNPPPRLIRAHPIRRLPCLRGMPATLMPLYDEVPHPKFFIVVSGGNGATIQTHGLIRFPPRHPPRHGSGPSQVLWLVAGLPPHLAQAVIDQQVVSTSRITLFVIPYDMPVIGYVGGADAVRDLLQAAIHIDREIAQFVQMHRNAFGPDISAEQAWDISSNSVAVEGIELLVNNTTTVAWHLHVTPPTNDNGAWLQLQRLFGRLCVMTALHGTACLQRSYHCRICPSITHPTGLCPLPRLPRWLGPTPATIAALEDADKHGICPPMKSSLFRVFMTRHVPGYSPEATSINASHQAATRAQDHIRGNAEAGLSAAPRAGANRGPGTAAVAKKPRKDLGKTKKGGDPKGKGKCCEHDDFF
ncbi:hypothetical protein B0H14DRAFT_3454003 [Mycena olivaceomarginata]|nr:hypothetical protein B0H14DRAFT_3454003 [Mycena olivaceomarginata]